MNKVIHNEAFAREAQAELSREGLYLGSIDGWAGPKTLEAFREWMEKGKPNSKSVPASHSDRLYTHALKDNGLKELPGAASHPRIKQAIEQAASWLNPDDSATAWCGCIMGLWCKELGLPVPSEYYRAASWLNVGTAVQFVEAIPGDIVVISRSGGNHVALFKEAKGGKLTLFGGNQSNAVTHTTFDRSLLRGIRRV